LHAGVGQTEPLTGSDKPTGQLLENQRLRGNMSNMGLPGLRSVPNILHNGP
jgi:hypothetical protein